MDKENNQIFGLTLYEVNRPPRLPVTNETSTTIQIRNLNLELTCPVCLGILHHTMTVMECLHRFCSSCISKSLRLGKKECPTCRVKCPSMRYLRPDPNFDGLITQIYPNLEEYEAKQESIIEQINKNVMKTKSLIESVEKGKQRQALAKSRSKKDFTETGERVFKKKEDSREQKKLVPKKKAKLDETEQHVFGTQNLEQSNKNGQNEINFVLLRHPDENEAVGQLSNKYLRTSKKLTVRHLYKFLARKLNQDEHELFSISLSSNPYYKLPEETTLSDIEKESFSSTDLLTLYYRIDTKKPTNTMVVVPTQEPTDELIPANKSINEPSNQLINEPVNDPNNNIPAVN